LSVVVVSVTSSTVRCRGSLVGAVGTQGKGNGVSEGSGVRVDSLDSKGIIVVVSK
jgi:hypothetical protein